MLTPYGGEKIFLLCLSLQNATESNIEGFCSCPGGLVASFGLCGVGAGVCAGTAPNADSSRLEIKIALIKREDFRVVIKRKAP